MLTNLRPTTLILLLSLLLASCGTNFESRTITGKYEETTTYILTTDVAVKRTDFYFRLLTCDFNGTCTPSNVAVSGWVYNFYAIGDGY